MNTGNLDNRKDYRTISQFEQALINSATDEKVTCAMWFDAHNMFCRDTYPIRKLIAMNALNEDGKLNLGNHRDHGDFELTYRDYFREKEKFVLEVKTKAKFNEKEEFLFRLKEDCFKRYITTQRPVLVGVNIYEPNPWGAWLLTKDLIQIQQTIKLETQYRWGGKYFYKIDIRDFHHFALKTLKNRDVYLDRLYDSIKQYEARKLVSCVV